MNCFNPDRVAVPLGHFIDGRLEQKSHTMIPVSRPSDGEHYGDIPEADGAIVDGAVASARRAQLKWVTYLPRERAALLRNWAQKIKENSLRLSRLEAATSTRPISSVISGDIPHLIETLLFFAELADKRGGAITPTGMGSFGFTRKEPYGVVGAILAWNYPLGLAGWKLAPALAAGNAVVVKPSELTPASAVALAEFAVQAGLPAGLINVVQGTGQRTGSLITRHPGIAKLSFTGSTRAGGLITEDCARYGLKPLTLELGGKSPQVVFSDADLPRAAQAIAGSILNNAGQECVAGSRVLLESGIAAEMTDLIITEMSKVTPGNTWDDTTTYAPLISATHAAGVEADIAMALENGGTLLAGGKMFPDFQGKFLTPTVIEVQRPDNPILAKEVFASVLTIQSFETEEEALQLANDSMYGLAAGLYTRDLSRALRVMAQLEAGTVWVNRYGRTDDFIVPTGGFKQSGTGKDLGIEAFDSNLRVKSVLIDL